MTPEEAAQWLALRSRYRVELFCDDEPEGLEVKEIVESWEDPDGRTYAIVKYKDKEAARFSKLFDVAVWDQNLSALVPMGTPAEEITSSFDTLEEAQGYLLRCISEQDLDPDIWISLLQPDPRRLPTFKGYTVDQRLGEFRKVDLGKEPEFIPFESPKGQKLLKEIEHLRGKSK